ncbi:hypothetical protein AB0M29_43740 [Streptomyces sp. NPDC051976]|uniref:hypothetical protein n=1 Tax=Streptomyces sp. NPDC051976 TaxID=3154947 RepID=UPI00343F28C4
MEDAHIKSAPGGSPDQVEVAGVGCDGDVIQADHLGAPSSPTEMTWGSSWGVRMTFSLRALAGSKAELTGNRVGARTLAEAGGPHLERLLRLWQPSVLALA